MTAKRQPATFSARLRALREAAILTQSELAARAGLTRLALVNMEVHAADPKWSTVQALADALGVSTEELRSR